MKKIRVYNVISTIINGYDDPNIVVYPFSTKEGACAKVKAMLDEDKKTYPELWLNEDDENCRYENSVFEEDGLVIGFSCLPFSKDDDTVEYWVQIQESDMDIDGPFEYKDIEFVGLYVRDMESLLDKAEDVEWWKEDDCGIDDGLDDGLHLMYVSYEIAFKDGQKLWLEVYYVEDEFIITDYRDF